MRVYLDRRHEQLASAHTMRKQSANAAGARRDRSLDQLGPEESWTPETVSLSIWSEPSAPFRRHGRARLPLALIDIHFMSRVGDAVRLIVRFVDDGSRPWLTELPVNVTVTPSGRSNDP